MDRGSTAIARRMMLQDGWNDLLLLQGAQAALALQSIERLNRLSDAEFRVFSQWGEDGILEWLVSRLPGIPQRFVEFGVEDYTEANTRFLLSHRNWKGLVLDGSAENIERIKRRSNAWRHDLTAIHAFITRENINSLITGAGFSGDIGLLSIDIDGNDYWVWEAIEAIRPWIVIVEYNAVLGDLKPLSIPYKADFGRMAAHHSGLYWGASVLAFDELAAQRGYTRMGSNRAGNNLFFVRSDLAKAILISDRTAMPSLYAESRDVQGNLTFIRGAGRRDIIDKMPVVDTQTGHISLLAEIGDIYSPCWTAILEGHAASEVAL